MHHDCVLHMATKRIWQQTFFCICEEYALKKSFFEAIQLVRFVSEAFGRRDATLLTAEGGLNCLLLKLKLMTD